MAVYLGLDCGGSSTRAMAIDSEMETLFNGQSGPANLSGTPRAVLIQNLRRATLGCPKPDAVCGCFAGLLDEHDRRTAIDVLTGLFPESHTRAEPDFMATLRAGSDADVCVIAGTGSLVCSLLDGRAIKSGGRGHLLGDEGSAFQYGRDALRHYLESPEAASEQLTKAVMAAFGAREPNEVIRSLYRSASPAAKLAKLAPALAADAKAGRPYALRSVEENVKALAKIVSSHVMAHFGGKKSVRITLAGGLWKSSGIFKQSFQSHLVEEMPTIELEIATIKRPPVMGAVDLAMELAIGN